MEIPSAKTSIPEDQPLYDQLNELCWNFRHAMNVMQPYFTDAANAVREADYMVADEHLNTIFNYYSELNVYILGAICAFKKHVGEWREWN